MTWGEKVAAWRKAKFWSQAKLAMYVGVSLQAVQLWEGNKRLPRIDTAAKLAGALGISMEQLWPAEKPVVKVIGRTLGDVYKQRRKEPPPDDLADLLPDNI